jgi:hypothetical protein
MSKHLSQALHLARPAALGIALFAAGGTMAVAQDQPVTTTPGGYNTFDPSLSNVDAWVPAWDAGTYDRHHILIGTVANSQPYRLLLSPEDPDGHAMMVDLKNGTVIRPEGTTLVSGMRVAVLGYWSKGTFIANRVILRGSN